MNDTLLPGPLVSPDWLAAHLDNPQLVVLDASTGTERDDAVTIAGAAHFAIDGALSAPSKLPHTMPDEEQFEREVRKLGVSDDSVIVVYDDQGIWSSPRAWWMFRAMGHDAVAVLDGGLPAWQAAGHPTVPAVAPTPGDFSADEVPSRIVDIDTVQDALLIGTPSVVDSRSAGRFAGTEPEPRPGLRGGHMPGAINLPYTEMLRDGRMRPVEELQALLEQATPNENYIFSCGSGMTACILALGATLSGHTAVQVYDGSWSEWGREGGPAVEASRA